MRRRPAQGRRFSSPSSWAEFVATRRGGLARENGANERGWSSNRRLALERLETRDLLAVASLVGGDLVVDDAGGATNDNVTIVANAVDQRYEVTDFANLVTTSIPGATGSGMTTVHVPFAAVTGTLLSVAFTEGGNDTVNIRGDFPVDVTIDGGAGSDNVNFNGDMTLAAGRSLAAMVETLDLVNASDIVTTGAGSVTLSASSQTLSGTLTSATTLTLKADSMLINSTAAIVSTADVVIEKLSTTSGVTLGLEQSGRLSLTDAELDRITSATMRIVNGADSGFFVGGALTHDNHLELFTPGPGGTEFQAPVTMAVDKNFTVLHPTLFPDNPHIRLFNSSADITTSGTGTIAIASQAAFDMASGSSLTTENGGIIVLARGAGTSYTPYNVEINGTVTSTGTGNISLTSLASTGQRGGMRIQGTVQSTSAANSPTQGRIYIEGENGTNDGANLHGVHITGAGLVTSDSGDIEIVGRGGVGPVATGVQLWQGSGGIIARNSASISIDGAGGVGDAPLGFYFSRAPGSSVISSENGSILIVGTGGTSGTGADAEGVSLYNNSGAAATMVSSTQGDITLRGVGGSTTTRDQGIAIRRDSGGAHFVKSTAGGSIVLEGVAGTGSNSFASILTNNGFASLLVTEGGQGDVTVIGDSFERVGGGFVASVTGGNLTFMPKTAGVPLSLGDADVLTGSKVLGLSNADLQGSAVTGRYVIGSTTSGNLSVDANIAPLASLDFERNMDLVSGGDIVFNASLQTIAAAGAVPLGALKLTPGPAGAVKPLFTGQDVITANGSSTFATSFAPGADLAINIAGTTVDAQYGRLNANGAVDLTSTELEVTGGFVTSLGQVFTIVSANTVTGQLTGLPENCSLVHNGRSLRVNYTATAVTLTDVGQPPTIDANSLAVSAGEGSPVVNAGTFNDPDGNATAVVTASVGTVVQDSGAGTWSWSIPTTDGPDGPFPVTITVTDPWCATATTTFMYSANNLPPTLSNAGAVAVNEGQTAVNSGAWGDPGVDTVTLSASVGAVVKNNDGTWSWSLGTSDGPDQSQVVAITATDSDGDQTPTTFQLTVNNVAPTVTSLSPTTTSIAQGGMVGFSGAFVDPGADAWHGAATVSLAGNPDVIVPFSVNPDKTFAFNLDFLTAGSHTLTVRVLDGEGGTSTSLASTVDVIAPPTLPGDFDRNAFVDGGDLLKWQLDLGSSVEIYDGSDGDGDGVVTAADLVVWRDHFGQAATASAVPTALALSENVVSVDRSPHTDAAIDAIYSAGDVMSLFSETRASHRSLRPGRRSTRDL